MKPNPKAQGFSDSPFARCESGFEKADIGLLAEPSIQARFGRTLKKLFPLPPEHSEPNEMHILLAYYARISPFPEQGCTDIAVSPVFGRVSANPILGGLRHHMFGFDFR